MQTLLVTIVWTASFISAMAAIILLPKQDDCCNAVGWIPISFYLLIGAEGMLAGLLTLLRIPFSLAASTLLHLGIICITLIRIKRSGQHQRLSIDITDLLVIVIAAITVALCVRAEFGANLTPHYLTSDPAVHLGEAKTIVDTGVVDGMYLAWNFIAELIWAFSPFLEGVLIYKALIIADALNLFFGGLLVYSVTTSIFANVARGKKLLFGILTIAYLLGYPLNGMLFGFCYLGVGVSFSICSLLFSVRFYNSQDLFDILGLFLSLFGVITGYALFAPIIFLMAFIVVVVTLRLDGRRFFTLHNGLLILFIFIIPGLLGILFTYIGTFGIGQSQTTDAASTIAWEGGIYRSFYSNFIIILPFAVLGIFSAFRTQISPSGERLSLSSNRILALFIIGAVLYLGVFAALLFAGNVSSYYYFKLYYLLAPLMFCGASVGAAEIANHPTAFLVATGITTLLLGMISVLKVDERLARRFEPYEVVSSGYHPCLDIFEWNLNSLQTATESPSSDVLQLYDVANSLYQKGGKPVPILGNYIYTYWYNALVRGAITNDYVVWVNEADSIIQRISNNCDYVLVLTKEDYATVGSEESRIILESLEDSLTVVFSNDSGYIARIE